MQSKVIAACSGEKVAIVPGLLSKLLAIAGELQPRQIALFTDKFLLDRS
jgi:hypothetical protein